MPRSLIHKIKTSSFLSPEQKAKFLKEMDEYSEDKKDELARLLEEAENQLKQSKLEIRKEEITIKEEYVRNIEGTLKEVRNEEVRKTEEQEKEQADAILNNL